MILFLLAVAYPTKILFWKRITATYGEGRLFQRLLLILQRYYFESESQLMYISGHRDYCCCLSYKDTILKANHSRFYRSPTAPPAVAYPTKILFWKRITAKASGERKKIRLLLILQRYYFESESQQKTVLGRNNERCCLSYKDTILKANHSPVT